jgi:hypothetical protein
MLIFQKRGKQWAVENNGDGGKARLGKVNRTRAPLVAGTAVLL